MTRLEANIEIVKKLTDYFYNNPDTRFHQALFNLNINEFETTQDSDSGFDRTFLKDKYNQESLVTLNKLLCN